MTHIEGTKIAKDLDKLLGVNRERAILSLADVGAFPEKLAIFVRVVGMHPDVVGRMRLVAYDVTFDYFSLGVDSDYLRMPMWPGTAQRIADSWHCVFPTPRMVNQIHTQAAKIVMATSGGNRGATATYVSTNTRITAAVNKLRLPLGTLISGHRKDVVISKGLKTHLDNVVIFGGLKDDGTWWQPTSNAASHSNRYVDYSHGFRLVRWEMWVDNVAYDIRNVLKDAVLAPLISADGPLSMITYPLLSGS